jgi:hypothetical protein
VIGLLIFLFGTFSRLVRPTISAACKIVSLNEREVRRVHQSTDSVRLSEAARSKLAKEAFCNMATYRDPVSCFAPLEVLERLLEIRAEAGFAPAVYLLSPDDLADYLDAYGFDVYAFSEAETRFHFGDYRAPMAPGGDHAHCSLTAH